MKKKDLDLKEPKSNAKSTSGKKSEETPHTFDLEKAAFKEQLKFIKDEARLKALFCTRRAAKSYTGGLYLIQEALSHPMSNCLFIALTRETAKGIIWKDILKDLNLKYNLGMVFNGTTLTATLPNGSEIWVTGADADEDEMNKLLGRKYKLVVIDEASMFSINMQQLVYGVLKPATADQRGTICMLGTASNITRGLFFDVTQGTESGWSLHTWTAFNNPHVAEQWSEELNDIEIRRPLFKKTALFKQWYLNQWVIDDAALIYKFDKAKNKLPRLPSYTAPWHKVLGIFLGHYPDESALVTAFYNEESPNLFVINCEKTESDMNIISKKINDIDKIHSIETKVVYGLKKDEVNELNSRHEFGLISFDHPEKEKERWINMLNSDLINGNIFFMDQTNELQTEMETLVWETDNGKVKVPRKEHLGIPNQLANAFLGLWSQTYQYLFSRRGSKENKIDDWEKIHIQNLEEQVRRAQNPHHFDAQFCPDDDLFDFDKDEML